MNDLMSQEKFDLLELSMVVHEMEGRQAAKDLYEELRSNMTQGTEIKKLLILKAALKKGTCCNRTQI